MPTFMNMPEQPLNTAEAMSNVLINNSGLGSTYSAMSEGEALELVRSHYGIDGSLLRLSTEKDDTFRITTRNDRQFGLKISNPAEDPAEISLQVELLMHLERMDAAIPAPRVLPTIDGRPYWMHTDRAEQRRCVRLMTFLPGLMMDSTASNARERFCVGQVLGRLRHAMAEFRHPAAGRVLAWNVLHLLKLRDLLSAVPDVTRRNKLSRGMDRFATLEPRVLALRRQVLHNDFSKSNIVVDHSYEPFVRGIIDFGDAVHTAIAVDVSTALLNQLPRDLSDNPAQDPFADARDVLQGYLSVAELTVEELKLVPHLVMGRVIARALITNWRQQRFPENSAYIMRNTEQGWAQLDWFLELSVGEVSSTLA